MKTSLPLAEEKKISITYRVEAGCLGPQGESHLVNFCAFAQKELQSFYADYVIWNIVPRLDKTLVEVQYSIVGKRMTQTQAEKYLMLWDKNLDQFECEMSDKLAAIIDDFMGRQ